MNKKRILAFLLSMLITISSLPLHIMAEDDISLTNEGTREGGDDISSPSEEDALNKNQDSININSKESGVSTMSSEEEPINQILQKAELNVYKFYKDENTEKDLKNAIFELKGKPSRNEASIVKEASSDEKGNLSFKDIDVPSYWLLTEKSAPTGYETPNNQWIVHFIKSNNEKGYEVLVYKAPLSPIVDRAVNPYNSKLEVQIWKDTDGDGKVTITEYDENGNSKEIEKDVNIDTSGDGRNDAVSGATIRPQILDFWLEKDKQVREKQVDPLKIENKRRSLDKGELVVKKVDKRSLDNNGEPDVLEDATFELRKGELNADGKTYKKELVVNTIKTDNLGQATFKDLEEGVYFLREIRAPYGYQADDNERKIVVDNTGKTTAYLTGEDDKKIPNGNSEQVFANDENYPNAVNMKSRIVDIDYEKGTFVQFVYLNSNGTYYENDGDLYGYGRPYSPHATISLPYGTSATAITKVTKKRVWAGKLEVNIPDSKDFPNNYDYGSNATERKESDRSYNINLGSDHDQNQNGYVTIVKVEGTFDKTSRLSLKTAVKFEASASVWDGYYSYYRILNYTSNINHSVNAPEIQTGIGDKEIDNETDHPTILKFSVDNKKSINASGKFFLDKTDGKEYLTGAEFILAREENLDNPEKCRTISVKEKSSIEVSNIPSGKYVLKEVKSPIGYKLDDHLWDVSVDFFGNTTVTKKLKDGEKAEENTKFTGNVVNRQEESSLIPRMMKSSANDYEDISSSQGQGTLELSDIGTGFTLNTHLVDSKNNKDLNGIQLRLRRISPSYKKYELQDKTDSTDRYENLEDGAYILETYGSPYTGSVEESNRVDYRPASISFEIKDGKLHITDSNVGNNWDDFRNKLTINLEKLVSQDGYIHIINEPTSLEIKKVDSDKTDKSLPNASFELYEEVTKGNKSQLSEENIQEKKKEKISSATTNKDGFLKFEKLEQGKTYYIKETVPPAGYEVEKDKDGKDKYYGPYLVKEDGTISNGLKDEEEKLIDQPAIITNNKIPKHGKVIIKKVDNDGTKLDGAEFDIYNSDENWSLGDKLELKNEDNKNENKIERKSTGGLHTFSNIPKGYYIIKESKAPSGYLPSAKEIKVEVKDGGQTEIINKGEFTVDGKREDTSSVSSVSSYGNIVSMTEIKPESQPISASTNSEDESMLSSREEKDTYSLESLIRNNISAALSGDTSMSLDSGTEILTSGNTSDPMDLNQIYKEQDQPTGYKTDEKGTYPSPTGQTEPTVRNSVIPETNLHWYEANYRQPDKFVEGGYRPARLLPAAGVNKFARETETDGEYKIDLKVEGNLVNPDERVDVMIVYDNSSSMDEISPLSGRKRFDVAKEATTEFINNVLSPENNPKGYIKMGLVTYASEVLDGKQKTIKVDKGYKTWETPDYTYADFTSDKDKLIEKLPLRTPKDDGNQYFGGTFTSGALKYAGDILSDEQKSPKSHKKVIIHVTDGMPTKSLKVKKVENGRATEFYDSSDGYINIMGSGGNYWLADNSYYVGYTYRTKNSFYNYYKQQYYYYVDTEYYYGTYEEVTKKRQEMVDYYNNQTTLEHNFPNLGVQYSTIIAVGDISRETDLLDYHKKYTVDGYEIKDHGFAAISLAQNLIDNKGFEIYNLGIELGDPSKFNGGPKNPREASKNEALKVMNGMSSEGGKDHYYDVSNVENLTNVFTDIFRKLPQRTVYKAQVMDPMGKMVDLKIDNNILNSLNNFEVTENGEQVNYKILYDGRGKIPSGFASGLEEDFELTTSQAILKKDVLVLYNPDTRKLRIENFTLGENETLKLSYKVKLRTTDPKFIENYYYPTNGDTLLKPNPSHNAQWHFPRPSVKGPLKSIFVEKKWLDADGKPIENPSESEVKVSLQQRVKNKDGYVIQDWTNAKYVKDSSRDMIMTLNQANNWKGKFINLIEFDEEGNQYEYRLLESSQTGYKSEVILKDKNGKIVGEIAGGQGTAEIVNRKLREIKVEKIWKTDDDNKKTVTIKLLAYKNGLDSEEVSLENLKELGFNGESLSVDLSLTNEWKHTFTGLPLETSDGEKIIYKVIEEQIDGTNIEQLKDFEVDYNYNSETGTEEVINYIVPIVYFVNKRAVYPSSGGRGSLIFTLTGLSLMTWSYLGLNRRKNSRKRRKI